MNLLLAPEDFGNAAWINTNSTESLNVGLALDGTTTADKILPSAVSNAAHYVAQNVSITSGLVFFLSVFVKPQEMDNYFVALGGGPFAGEVSWLFDISAGSIIDTDNGTVATAEDGGIIEHSDGWYRLWVQSTPTATGAQMRIGPTHATSLRSSSDGYPPYTPNGTDGGLMWGAQGEHTALTNYTSVLGTEITLSSPLDSITYPRDSMPTDEARFQTFIDDSGITQTGDLTRDYRAALHSVLGLSGNDIDYDLPELFKRYNDSL